MDGIVLKFELNLKLNNILKSQLMDTIVKMDEINMNKWNSIKIIFFYSSASASGQVQWFKSRKVAVDF